jgi:hypothetical protein
VLIDPSAQTFTQILRPPVVLWGSSLFQNLFFQSLDEKVKVASPVLHIVLSCDGETVFRKIKRPVTVPMFTTLYGESNGKCSSGKRKKQERGMLSTGLL